MTSERIRKQVYSLSPTDLALFPLWEFCSDEETRVDQDEATVRTSLDKEVVGYSPGVYVVAANVTFGDGTDASGYLYSGAPHDFAYIQPNVVTEKSQVNLWLGNLELISHADRHLTSCYGLLGKTCDQLFPLTFKSRVAVNGTEQVAVLDSFLGLTADGRLQRLR